jgi:hypothetical protein
MPLLHWNPALCHGSGDTFGVLGSHLLLVSQPRLGLKKARKCIKAQLKDFLEGRAPGDFRGKEKVSVEKNFKGCTGENGIWRKLAQMVEDTQRL